MPKTFVSLRSENPIKSFLRKIVPMDTETVNTETITIKCVCCGNPITLTEAEWTQRAKDMGRPQRYFAECRDETCIMWKQTFFIANEAEYLDRDFTNYLCDKKAG